MSDVYRIKKEDMSKFKFLFSAIGDDETRPFLMYAHYNAEKSRIEATDGRRLHIMYIKRDPGHFFEFLGDKSCLLSKRQDILFKDSSGDLSKFPNVEIAIDDEKAYDKQLPEAFFKKNRMNRDAPLWIAETGIPLNIRYLKDIADISWTVSRQSKKPNGVIKFTSPSENFIAYIMPMCNTIQEEPR